MYRYVGIVSILFAFRVRRVIFLASSRNIISTWGHFTAGPLLLQRYQDEHLPPFHFGFRAGPGTYHERAPVAGPLRIGLQNGPTAGPRRVRHRLRRRKNQRSTSGGHQGYQEGQNHPMVQGKISKIEQNWTKFWLLNLEYLITVQHLLNVHNGKLDFIWLAKKDNLMLSNWW